MKGAALARAARGWHADARDKALGADLKNEDIVYMFCEAIALHLLRVRLEYHKTSNRVYVICPPDLGFSFGVSVDRRLRRELGVLHNDHLLAQDMSNRWYMRASES